MTQRGDKISVGPVNNLYVYSDRVNKFADLSVTLYCEALDVLLKPVRYPLSSAFTVLQTPVIQDQVKYLNTTPSLRGFAKRYISMQGRI